MYTTLLSYWQLVQSDDRPTKVPYHCYVQGKKHSRSGFKLSLAFRSVCPSLPKQAGAFCSISDSFVCCILHINAIQTIFSYINIPVWTITIIIIIIIIIQSNNYVFSYSFHFLFMLHFRILLFLLFVCKYLLFTFYSIVSEIVCKRNCFIHELELKMAV